MGIDTTRFGPAPTPEQLEAYATALDDVGEVGEARRTWSEIGEPYEVSMAPTKQATMQRQRSRMRTWLPGSQAVGHLPSSLCRQVMIEERRCSKDSGPSTPGQGSKVSLANPPRGLLLLCRCRILTTNLYHDSHNSRHHLNLTFCCVIRWYHSGFAHDRESGAREGAASP